MRYHLSGVLGVIVGTALAAPATALAAQQPDTMRIRVTGSAQVNVRLVPTRAVMHLLIENTARTTEEAVRLTQEASRAVFDTLRNAGGAEDLTLVQYGVVPTPVTHPTPAEAPRSSYVSRAAVRFVAPLSRMQALTSAAYARGASVSAQPHFQHEGLDTAITRLLEQGTAIARQRAEAIARGLGGTLGALMSVESHPLYNGADYAPSPGFPASTGYDHQPRPVPEIRYAMNVTASWVFVRR